ncbi:alkaline phosphatase PhoX [Nocardioides aurantiacus]|uniref:Secreted PhoX family phosphatase n=1 Tax=Nocardioides aurantiacus TaxID=86796 RepID=A0A3N2CQU5_9ACTN|nr:alkaline phosphatase PhoX [Nocardioides aurantiacus]ROR89907.1 hypothetical protein EDD33_0738 [Nocardioides aurantiacus]
MNPSLSRRGLLGGATAGGLGIALSGSVEAVAGPRRPAVGYGELVADPRGLLALPPGFSYEIVAQAGVTQLANGEGPTPTDQDANGVFGRASGGAAIVCNHEIGGSESPGVPPLPGLTYDPGARGGTTTIEVDPRGRRLSEYVSVAGTHNNCAGGETPWNTWLTCEETEARRSATLQKDHGYVFEVDPSSQLANVNKAAVPLRFLGRYAHEAVAVDPATSTICETEDAGNPNGLYYRWTPPQGFRGGLGALRKLAESPGGDTAGTLEAMSCWQGDRHVPDLSLATRAGTRYQVRWVEVPDRDARTVSVRKQLTDQQVTRSRKLEGAWWGDGGAYFVASFARRSDGSANEHDGQVWFYDPRSRTVTLRTIFSVNPDPEVDAENYDGPDNMTLSPHGGLILAEDGNGVQHLVGVTDQGKTFPMARNDLNGSEFAGPAFSPDGTVLFANIQSPGYVLAITGPWGRPSNAAR